jgi:hypothetical protein
MSADAFSQACHEGALAQINAGLKERLKRLKELADNMTLSLKRARMETGADLPPQLKSQQESLVNKWPEMEAQLEQGPPAAVGIQHCDTFLKEWEQIAVIKDHCQAIKALTHPVRAAGAAWLQEIVNSAEEVWAKI